MTISCRFGDFYAVGARACLGTPSPQGNPVVFVFVIMFSVCTGVQQTKNGCKFAYTIETGISLTYVLNTTPFNLR